MSTGGFNPLLAAGDLVGGAVSMVGNFASDIGKGFAGMFTPKPPIKTQIMQPAGNVVHYQNLDPQASSLSDFARRNVDAWRSEPIVEYPATPAATWLDGLGNILKQAGPAIGETLYNKYLADDLSGYTGTNPPETLEQPGPVQFVGPPAPVDFWSKIIGVKPNQPGGYSVGYAPQSAGISKASLPALAIAGVIILLLLRKK